MEKSEERLKSVDETPISKKFTDSDEMKRKTVKRPEDPLPVPTERLDSVPI